MGNVSDVTVRSQTIRLLSTIEIKTTDRATAVSNITLSYRKRPKRSQWTIDIRRLCIGLLKKHRPLFRLEKL